MTESTTSTENTPEQSNTPAVKPTTEKTRRPRLSPEVMARLDAEAAATAAKFKKRLVMINMLLIFLVFLYFKYGR